MAFEIGNWMSISWEQTIISDILRSRVREVSPNERVMLVQMTRMGVKVRECCNIGSRTVACRGPSVPSDEKKRKVQVGRKWNVNVFDGGNATMNLEEGCCFSGVAKSKQPAA